MIRKKCLSNVEVSLGQMEITGNSRSGTIRMLFIINIFFIWVGARSFSISYTNEAVSYVINSYLIFLASSLRKDDTDF